MGSVIYSGGSESLYLVVTGRVKLSRLATDGSETSVRIVPPESLFGERALIDADSGDCAVSLDRVNVMAWSRSEIEHQIEKMPRLGLALLEEFSIATHDMEDRVETMATRKVPERIMLSLLQLQRTLGEPQADGVMRMAPLTHKVIAQYAGTTREIVTAQMNRLRSLGMVRYSRRFIEVDCDALEQAVLNGRPALGRSNCAFTAVTGV
jgi:CRP-like cAMP-binding protein